VPNILATCTSRLERGRSSTGARRRATAIGHAGEDQREQPEHARMPTRLRSVLLPRNIHAAARASADHSSGPEFQDTMRDLPIRVTY